MNCTECQKEISELAQECCEYKCKRCKAELCVDCGENFSRGQRKFIFKDVITRIVSSDITIWEKKG